MVKIRITKKREGSERRKSQRMAIPALVNYKLSPKRGVLEQVFCQDISGGGFRIRTDVQLKVGKKIETQIYFPHDKKPVGAQSRVVWCKEVRNKKKKKNYDIGIQHLKIYSRDRRRFVFLFCEMMISYFILGSFRVRV